MPRRRFLISFFSPFLVNSIGVQLRNDAAADFFCASLPTLFCSLYVREKCDIFPVFHFFYKGISFDFTAARYA